MCSLRICCGGTDIVAGMNQNKDTANEYKMMLPHPQKETIRHLNIYARCIRFEQTGSNLAYAHIDRHAQMVRESQGDDIDPAAISLFRTPMPACSASPISPPPSAEKEHMPSGESTDLDGQVEVEVPRYNPSARFQITAEKRPRSEAPLPPGQSEAPLPPDWSEGRQGAGEDEDILMKVSDDDTVEGAQCHQYDEYQEVIQLSVAHSSLYDLHPACPNGV